MTCTYRFTGPAGEPVVIEGMPAMKAYLAEGGLAFFGLQREQSSLSGAKFSAARLAPNGKPSKLTEEQWHQVRTPEFKRWFGDWEKFATEQGGVWNDAAGEVSKVVDPETGEPKVVYHGAAEAGFTIFEPGRNPRGTPGAFFSDNRDIATSYAGRRAPEAELAPDEDGEYDSHRGIYSVFLNIRNPKEEHFEGANWDGSREGQFQVVDEDGERLYAEDGTGYFHDEEAARALADANPGAEVQDAEEFWYSTNNVVEEAHDGGHDGAIMYDVVDNGSLADVWESSNVFVVFDSTQVKSAVANVGTFDPNGGDIRFSRSRTQRLTPEQRALTQAPQFGEWFNNSRMRAQDGTPLLFMHGTPSNFEAFSSSALGSSSSHSSAGLGHFFTRDRETAKRYAQGGTILEGWLRIEKPYVMQLEEAQGFDDTRAAAARRAALQRQGYDGAVILNDQGKPWAVVAFEPWQFKSTDNNGSFDEFDDRFRFSRTRVLPGLTPAQEAAADRVLGARRTWADTWQAFKQDWAKNLKQGIFDQFMPLRELDPKAYMLARLSKGGDSTLEALMLYGKLRLDANGATDVDYTRGGGMQGFASKMSKLKGEHERFMLWVAAQRADRLMQVGLENLWTPQDIADLSTLDQGSMADGTARAPLYAQALQDLNEFNDNVLEIAEGSGLIDPATRQMYAGQPYVPFYRLQEEGVAGFGVKAGLVNQYAWKKLKGGTQKLNEDLLANLLHNWSHLITAAAKNRAARATLDAATALGIANEVPAGAPGKGFVGYKDAGRERKFAVSDPHVFDAVTALEYAGLGPWAKPLTTAKHWLTIGVTANPTFKLRNLMRDSISAIGQASLSYNPAKNIAQGWGSTAKESETRAHMLAAGGMIRFGSMLDGQHSQRAQDLINAGVDPAMILDSDSKIKDFWKRYVHPALAAYNELGDRTEQVNRAALYDQLRARGMDHMEASYWARDMMDFSMHGKWTAIRGLTQVVPFMNARLQGLYKLGRASKDDIRRLGTVLGAVSLFSLGLLFAAKGDDDDWKDWQARTEADRNNYWWFKVGGHAFRIPKPFEIGAVGTIAERGYEIMTDDEMTPKRFGKVMSQIVLSQLAMNPTPQLFKPMMDIYANRDAFTGMNIETPGMEKMRKEDRFDERTSEVARFLGSLGLPDPTQLVMGRWDTLSPKQVDYLARGYFSWLATATTVVLDFGIRPMLDRGERPAMRLKDAFIVGNFAEELPANGSRYVQRMYDQAQEIEEAYNSWHSRLKAGDQAGAQEVLDAERGKIALHSQVEMVKRATSLVNVQIRKVEADKVLSAEEKRIRLDALYARKNQLAQDYRGF